MEQLPMTPLEFGRKVGHSLMLALGLACGFVPAAAQAQAPTTATPQTEHLRVVGGLAGVNQFTRHEEPFWARVLPGLTHNRVTTEIVPFDKAGLTGPELLRAVQIGAAPFGTVILGLAAAAEPELELADLAGLNPDFDSLRRSVQGYRPRLAKLLKQKYDLELLAVYTYPAQVMYCTRAFSKLADLAGRRVRVAAGSQAEFIAALGARPVQMPFSQVVPGIKAGSVDCAVTGTMSGNTIGLHEVTSHIHPMALSWGLAAFVVQAERWRQLQPAVRAVLERELPILEREIWAEAQLETEDGLACNTGAARCKSGHKGRMTLVEDTPADHRLRLELLHQTAMPGWLQRCGAHCMPHWQTLLSSRPDLRAR
jgi:TRAP-type C4-dicarboxylate transport system substrate-binding protein